MAIPLWTYTISSGCHQEIGLSTLLFIYSTYTYPVPRMGWALCNDFEKARTEDILLSFRTTQSSKEGQFLHLEACCLHSDDDTCVEALRTQDISYCRDSGRSAAAFLQEAALWLDVEVGVKTKQCLHPGFTTNWLYGFEWLHDTSSLNSVSSTVSAKCYPLSLKCNMFYKTDPHHCHQHHQHHYHHHHHLPDLNSELKCIVTLNINSVTL